MKMKLCAMAVLISVISVVQAQAGGNHHASSVSAGRSGSSRGGYYRAGAGRIYAGNINARFNNSAYAMRGFGQNRVYSSRPVMNGTNQFAGRSFANAGSFNSRFAQNRTFSQNRTFAQTGRNFRAGNNLRANWQGHVFARQSSNWHRDWDRGRDHWWNGHRCAFIGGSWVVFDFGFDPWWPYGYPYAYPYPPYPTGYYPDNYAPPANDYGYGSDQEETPSQRYYRENGK